MTPRLAVILHVVSEGRFVGFVFSLPISAILEFEFIETSWSDDLVSLLPPASSQSLQRIRSSRILLETDTVSPRARILGGLKVVKA